MNHSALGSLEGRILSTHISPAHFVINHELTQQLIQCFIEGPQLPHHALHQRVCVSGLIQYDAANQPLYIQVTDIRILRSAAELSPPEHFLGILNQD